MTALLDLDRLDRQRSPARILTLCLAGTAHEFVVPTQDYLLLHRVAAALCGQFLFRGAALLIVSANTMAVARLRRDKDRILLGRRTARLRRSGGCLVLVELAKARILVIRLRARGAALWEPGCAGGVSTVARTAILRRARGTPARRCAFTVLALLFLTLFLFGFLVLCAADDTDLRAECAQIRHIYAEIRFCFRLLGRLCLRLFLGRRHFLFRRLLCSYLHAFFLFSGLFCRLAFPILFGLRFFFQRHLRRGGRLFRCSGHRRGYRRCFRLRHGRRGRRTLLVHRRCGHFRWCGGHLHLRRLLAQLFFLQTAHHIRFQLLRFPEALPRFLLLLRSPFDGSLQVRPHRFIKFQNIKLAQSSTSIRLHSASQSCRILCANSFSVTPMTFAAGLPARRPASPAGSATTQGIRCLRQVSSHCARLASDTSASKTSRRTACLRTAISTAVVPITQARARAAKPSMV